MLKIFIECGLYETTVTTPTGATKSVVKLKLSKLQEAMLYVGGTSEVESLASLRNLDKSVRLHWIMAGAKTAPQFGRPHERVWVRPENSSNTVILKAGHMVRKFLTSLIACHKASYVFLSNRSFKKPQPKSVSYQQASSYVNLTICSPRYYPILEDESASHSNPSF
jgi:hypothetical protein